MKATQTLSRRTKRFFLRLHEDESGPNTVEWILLVVVALVVLIGIYAIVAWLGGKAEEEAGETEAKKGEAKKNLEDFNPN